MYGSCTVHVQFIYSDRYSSNCLLCISSSSTLSSAQITKPPPSSIPLVSPNIQGSGCKREGGDNSSWCLSKFSSTMTKSTRRTTEQEIVDIASGRDFLSTRNQNRLQKFNPSSVTHTDGNDKNNNQMKKKKNSQSSKKATVNLAMSSSPVIHDDSDDCLSDTILNSILSNHDSASTKPDLPFLPQELPLPSITSKKQKKGKSKKLKKKKSKKKSVVYVQSLIGDRVAAVLSGTNHFGTILSTRILDNGKKYWEIIHYDNFDEEEVDAIKLSTCQDLYNLEVENDIVWQQKQNVNNIIFTDIFIYLI